MLLKTLHITLIISLLSSSVGVVVNQHFCREQLKHTSLFTAVKSCHDKKVASCPMHVENAGFGLDKKDCCNNTSQFLKTSQEQQMNQADPVKGPVANVNSKLSVLRFLLMPQASRTNTTEYHPPPLIADFPSLFQIFRL
ncbi:MAG: hypothetical protein R2824_01355 [Saprospiraceae bacterium]